MVLGLRQISVVGGHSFVSICSSTSCTLGLKVDGSVWGWGVNGDGQLGDGTISNRSSPVSVIGGHSFVSVYAGKSSCFAVKSDDTLWGWGKNTSFELGISDGAGRSSPTLLPPFPSGNYNIRQLTFGGSINLFRT